jgi:hypothetical protein
MNDQALVGALQASGCVTEENVARWRDAAALMATLDAIGRDGVTAVVKIDGGRPDAIYTVLVSGAQLGESFFRKDGNDPLALLRDAIDFYKAEVWSKRPRHAD